MSKTPTHPRTTEPTPGFSISTPKPLFSKRGLGEPAPVNPARRQGSLLILTVTVLVIIALLGIAFLQRVRMDQFATARHERQFMPLVINGILGEINSQLKGDIFDNTPNGKPLYDYPWTKHVKEIDAFFGDGTKVRVNGAGKNDGAGTFVSTHEDDRWLASTAPVFVPTGSGEYRWLHLTNLTGIWLDLPDITVASPSKIPTEWPIKGGTAQIGQIKLSDTDIPLTDNPADPKGLAFTPAGFEKLGVDADGDGILDSRWQWAPTSVRNLGGRKYVMALRIVDLSSMLNVNTATALTSNGTAANDGRGYNPSWADLSRLFERVDPVPRPPVSGPLPAGQWSTELQNVLKTRVAKVTTPTITISNLSSLNPGVIEDIWLNQAGIYGNLDRNFLINSELDLRRNGGINDIDTESPLETQALRLLRQVRPDGTAWPSNLIEGNYTDVVDPTNSLSSQNAKISRWFYGAGGPNLKDTDSSPVAGRKFPGIRHMLTTQSGAAVYATKFGGANSRADFTKFSLGLQRNTSDWDTLDHQKLREQIEAVFKLPTPSTPNIGWYLGLNNTKDMNDLINEYILAIRDYSDADSTPSNFTLTDNVTIAYGLERLPFIREVYVQALYADQNLLDINGNPDTDPTFIPGDTNFDSWKYDEAPPDPNPTSNGGGVGGDTRAMVIELGNPFSHRILGADLDRLIRIEVKQAGTLVGAWDFDNSTPDIEPRDETSNGDTLIIYSPPMSDIDETLTSGAVNLKLDLNPPADAVDIKLPPGTLTSSFNPGGPRLVIELYVNTVNGMVMYDQIDLDPKASLPAKGDISLKHPANATQEHQFAQASSARDSRIINFVVDDGRGSADLKEDPPKVSGTFQPATVDRLGDDNKGKAIQQYGGIYTNFFDRLQLPIMDKPTTDKPMRSIAELGWIHMFGFTSTATFSQRMSAIGPKGLKANRHFLLIDPRDPDFKVLPSPTDPSNPGAGLPHAALLMDMVTTIGLHKDGLDNDNNDGDNDPTTSTTILAGQTEKGIDNPNELFVPGLINVNTAPLHILTLGAPNAEAIADTEALMRTIVAYRDQPIRTPAGHGDYWAATPFNDTAVRTQVDTLNPSGPVVDRQGIPGIASLGELMFLNPGDPQSDMMRYGLDTTAALPLVVDLYPDPDDVTAATAKRINQGDDNEQRLARFQTLSQTFSVRSDRFVVYAVVRGYADRAFDTSPIETARFIAIIDRGAMKDKDDNPRVIGFIRLK